MSVEKKFYGYTADQKEISSYTLTNKSGMKAVLLDIGAVIESLLVPDKNGNLVDVVLGFGDPKLYLENNGSLGAVVGRHANRIANATYTLNGVTYKLEANNGPNNLHSNPGSYYKRLWDAKIGENSVAFTLHSPDGDQNYPGNFTVTVTYTLSDENGLSLKYDMESDKNTLANLTNHSYFNMDGHDSGDVLSQKVWIDADQFTPSDATLIPTGEYRDVTGTPFDFRTEKTIGQDIHADDEQIKNGGGYDHNYVLKTDGKFAKVASMTGAKSGIVMDVYTDMPGMQVYTANGTTIECGKNKSSYKPFCGACFETQFFPDSIHHENFKSCVLKANTKFTTVTEYRFHTV